jgi:hypothetical protein
MKNKNNIFYAASGLFCFMAFASLAGALGQYLFFIIMLIISAIVSLFITPKIRRINSAKYAKDIETVDASEPIRLKEVFSNSFFYKLERKYGERIAVLIITTGGVAIASPVLFAMVLLRVATVYHVIVWGIGFGVIIWLIMYRQMKKDLQRIKEDASA